MSTEKQFLESLSSCKPEKLDYSRRGDGMNAVWKINAGNDAMILKTYSSRRGPIKTFLTNLDHLMTGRTPYTASARCSTEKKNIELWRKCGCSAPALQEFDPGIPAGIPWLCMEYIDGPILSDMINDADIPEMNKEKAFRRFCSDICARHEKALERGEPGLIQEHASLEHVIIGDSGPVIIDLEVSYTSHQIDHLICRELCGYVRSMIKLLDKGHLGRYLDFFVCSYTSRSRLKSVYNEYFANRSLFLQLAYNFDRAVLKRNRSTSRYDAAMIINNLLAQNQD